MQLRTPRAHARYLCSRSIPSYSPPSLSGMRRLPAYNRATERHRLKLPENQRNRSGCRELRMLLGVLKTLAIVGLTATTWAGAMNALTGPVTAERASNISISVNRSAKGDRLPVMPLIKPVRQNPISIEKPTAERPLDGCEPAISPFATAPRAHLLTACTA